MAELRLSPNAVMFYRDETFCDPWIKPEAALLLHGNGESGLAWNGWMPHFGRRFRVIRPDMRGFGLSTPMPVEHPWTPDEIVADFIALCDRLEVEQFHLVGAKVGGAIAIHLAATHPQRIRTLTLVAARPIGRESPNGRAEAIALIEKQGVEAWARNTMTGRLGTNVSPEMVEGWIQLMGRTAASTQLGFFPRVSALDMSGDLPQITAPTLVITTEGNRYNRSNIDSAAETRGWQHLLPNSELLSWQDDSFHVAVTDPERCAVATLDFIDRMSAARERLLEA